MGMNEEFSKNHFKGRAKGRRGPIGQDLTHGNKGQVNHIRVTEQSVESTALCRVSDLRLNT